MSLSQHLHLHLLTHSLAASRSSLWSRVPAPTPGGNPDPASPHGGEAARSSQDVLTAARRGIEKGAAEIEQLKQEMQAHYAHVLRLDRRVCSVQRECEFLQACVRFRDNPPQSAALALIPNT